MKRKLIVVFGIALFVILMLALYPRIGKKAIKDSTYDFLFEDGINPLMFLMLMSDTAISGAC